MAEFSAALQQKRLRDAQRETEENLRASEERLQIAVSSSNTALWDWDIASNAVVYSPIWKSQLGYADHEIANAYHEWEKRLHPDDRERVIRELRRHEENPAAHGGYCAEFRLQHRDGSYRWILSQALTFAAAPTPGAPAAAR